ncbi:MAG: hypothetical protein WCT22_05835 [Patescibacteria group bacterium]
MKQAVTETLSIKGFQQIYFSNSYEPFLPFFLFYSHYIPSDKSCHVINSVVNFENIYFVGKQINQKYFFGIIDWPNLINSPDSIYVLTKPDIEKINSTKLNYTILKTIKPQYSEQETFYIITINTK